MSPHPPWSPCYANRSVHDLPPDQAKRAFGVVARMAPVAHQSAAACTHASSLRPRPGGSSAPSRAQRTVACALGPASIASATPIIPVGWPKVFMDASSQFVNGHAFGPGRGSGRGLSIKAAASRSAAAPPPSSDGPDDIRMSPEDIEYWAGLMDRIDM